MDHHVFQPSSSFLVLLLITSILLPSLARARNSVVGRWVVGPEKETTGFRRNFCDELIMHNVLVITLQMNACVLFVTTSFPMFTNFRPKKNRCPFPSPPPLRGLCDFRTVTGRWTQTTPPPPPTEGGGGAPAEIRFFEPRAKQEAYTFRTERGIIGGGFYIFAMTRTPICQQPVATFPVI